MKLKGGRGLGVVRGGGKLEVRVVVVRLGLLEGEDLEEEKERKEGRDSSSVPFGLIRLSRCERPSDRGLRRWRGRERCLPAAATDAGSSLPRSHLRWRIAAGSAAGTGGGAGLAEPCSGSADLPSWVNG
jgi:hypothetical protein